MEHKLRKTISEPALFGLLLRTPTGAMLHVGIYDCLEDAIEVATKELNQKFPLNPGFQMELWTKIEGRKVLEALLESEEGEVLKNVSGVASAEIPIPIPPPPIEPSRSEIMRELIESGDMTAVNHARHKLTENETRFIIEEIKKRKPKS